MLALEDAVALSVWYGAPRLKACEMIQRGACSPTLESVIDAVGAAHGRTDLLGRLRQRAAEALSAARRLAIDAVALGDPRYRRCSPRCPMRRSFSG